MFFFLLFSSRPLPRSPRAVHIHGWASEGGRSSSIFSPLLLCVKKSEWIFFSFFRSCNKPFIDFLMPWIKETWRGRCWLVWMMRCDALVGPGRSRGCTWVSTGTEQNFTACCLRSEAHQTHDTIHRTARINGGKTFRHNFHAQIKPKSRRKVDWWRRWGRAKADIASWTAERCVWRAKIAFEICLGDAKLSAELMAILFFSSLHFCSGKILRGVDSTRPTIARRPEGLVHAIGRASGRRGVTVRMANFIRNFSKTNFSYSQVFRQHY